MLEQVAGRAGRRPRRLRNDQRLNPDHEVLKYVKAHDYNAYYNAEISDLEKYAYPLSQSYQHIY